MVTAAETSTMEKPRSPASADGKTADSSPSAHGRRATARVPRGRWRRRLIVVAAMVASLYLARHQILYGLAAILTVDTAGAPADYIVPLGGDPETRPFVAAALYRRGIAPEVLVFQHGGNDAIRRGLRPSESLLYERVLELEGVPAAAIRGVPGVVTSTWDEALAARRWVAAQSRDRVRLVLVTSPEHTRRARWTFRRALADLRVEVDVAPARHQRFDESNWWTDDEGVLLYLHEFVKQPYYWFSYAF